MSRNINHIVITVLVVLLISLILGTGQAISADWSNVLKEKMAKCEEYNKEIKDMTIIGEMKTVSSEEGMTSSNEVKRFFKGKKFRSEITMQMPGMPKEMGGMTTIIIHNGKDTWIISSLVGITFSNSIIFPSALYTFKSFDLFIIATPAL